MRALLCATLVVSFALLGACEPRPLPSQPPKKLPMQDKSDSEHHPGPRAPDTYGKPTDAELKARLTREQYEVTQQKGTESPFQNAYWDNHQAGIYVEVTTGEPLFSSLDKFDSGTGWPSFSRALNDQNVVTRDDGSHGMTRVEVRSKHGDSHLGHLFDDGPGPGGQRFCMNSASMRFVPADQLVAQGYDQFAKLFPSVKQAGQNPATALPAASETAIFAGGCFWGMENILRKIPGVLDTEVGYTGGSTREPSYEEVTTGQTGHAEAVRVTFTPSLLSYEALLGYFFRMHDPTTRNRQENDIGTQYRSAIFYASEAQKKTAERVKAAVDGSGKWKRPVATEITAAGSFYPAEDYHQDYLVHTPDGYNCHVLRD